MNYRPVGRSRGFTIVELLMVIVVIAILATITIVAYNNIQRRANTSSAATSAAMSVKKTELYNTEIGGYPTTSSLLTAANSAASYRLNGVTITGTAIAAAPASPSTLNFWRCGTAAAAAATSLATITVTTGIQYRYWNYMTNALVTVNAGLTTGNSSAGYAVTCYIAS
ncbi:MAG: prepilin-type N-terminal cleavage/methylation domain-containing protein [Candidatus Saccharimonas sp.]